MAGPIGLFHSRRIRQMTERPGESEHTTICLLGASFRTGNLGVDAITESTISCALKRWPQAHFVIVGTNAPQPPVEDYDLAGRCIRIPQFKILVYAKRLSSPNHVLRIFVYRLAKMVLPQRFAWWLSGSSSDGVLAALLRSNLVLDASSGDGFTDLYGVDRFYREAVRKCLVLALGRDLVLLPQTLGPFRHSLCRVVAGLIVRRCHRVLLRDEDSLQLARRLATARDDDARIRLVPDLAFALECREWEGESSRSPAHDPHTQQPVIGINISGLLFHEPQRHDFRLQAAYRSVIPALIEAFLSRWSLSIVLVPHVLGGGFESDEPACEAVAGQLAPRWRGCVTIASRFSAAAEAKCFIGGCDFFIGSRMHACIAALSQGIPTLGLAYSDKFRGVFESVGTPDGVIDLRTCGIEEVVDRARLGFDRRHRLAESLAVRAPLLRKQVLEAFDDIEIQTHG